MTTLTWKPIAEDAALGWLDLGNPNTRKQRTAAYERFKNSEYGSTFRTTHITIAENTTLDLPLTDLEVGFNCIEIVLMPNAQVTLSYVENEPRNKDALVVVKARLKKGASLNSVTGFFGGASASFFQETLLEEEGAETRQRTIFYGDETQKFEIFSTTKLMAPNTRAEITSKGVLDDSAHGRFDGAIEITEQGKGAEAHLTEETLLLSPDTRVNAIPGLKIGTNDVQASHAASVTRLDDEHLFYFGSRGVDEQTASTLIVEGFLRTGYEGSDKAELLETLVAQKLARGSSH